MRHIHERRQRHTDIESFTHDVFLSYSSADKAVVRELAERLRQDGIRVWFDEWDIKLGDSILSNIESALDTSRVLLLCMSKHAFSSDWATLENQTFRFRDPLNKQRRFIPVRLDDTVPPGSLAQFLYADWRAADREQEYTKLLSACRPKVNTKASQEIHEQEHRAEYTLQLAPITSALSYSFSSDGKRALTIAPDGKVCLWNLQTGQILREFGSHSNK